MDSKLPVSSTNLMEPTPRRTFMCAAAAIVIGGVASFVPVVCGVLCFLDPILRRGNSVTASDGFLKAANVSDLPSDGTPERFTLRTDSRDAWTLYRSRVIGSIYLRKINDQVIAFNDTCPHLGCKVDYHEPTQRFFCPCHQSSFNLDGARQNKTPPRNLDELTVEIRGDKVYVKYQNFRTGDPQKQAIG